MHAKAFAHVTAIFGCEVHGGKLSVNIVFPVDVGAFPKRFFQNAERGHDSSMGGLRLVAKYLRKYLFLWHIRDGERHLDGQTSHQHGQT